MALERLRGRFRAGIPQPDRAVVGSRHQPLATRTGLEWPSSVCGTAPEPVSHSLTVPSRLARRPRRCWTRMALKRLQGRSRAGIPQPNHAVVRSRRQ